MHDHDHGHPNKPLHRFGEITAYEGTLFHRSQLMHLATEIFAAGVPKGRVTNMDAEDSFYTPKEAVAVAVELIAAVDEQIIGCRLPEESVEDDAPAGNPEP